MLQFLSVCFYALAHLLMNSAILGAVAGLDFAAPIALHRRLDVTSFAGCGFGGYSVAVHPVSTVALGVNSVAVHAVSTVALGVNSVAIHAVCNVVLCIHLHGGKCVVSFPQLPLAGLYCHAKLVLLPLGQYNV
jgi:hypothetical protein